jgi:hypothetical protein
MRYVEKFGRARQATGDHRTRCTRFSCRIIKATVMQLEYLTLTAFPWQQWLRERASMLRFTYIASLVLDNLRFQVVKIICNRITRCFRQHVRESG